MLPLKFDLVWYPSFLRLHDSFTEVHTIISNLQGTFIVEECIKKPSLSNCHSFDHCIAALFETLKDKG